MSADTASRARRLAVLRMELAIQRREPLTVLYMLVLGLLAMAFAAAGPVELVRGRGAVPRDAAWSLMLASTALTAFGQVITTMVAATVVLRDRADRVSALLVASRLTPREYFTGKLGAALVLLAVIYASIPVGLVAGAAVAGGSTAGALLHSLPAYLLVVLPTMLAVGCLQFAVGVLSGRLWVIVGQGLLLIWCWSAAVDVAPRDGASLLALLADPFGSAPLVYATRHWTDAQRSTLPMPVTAVLLLGRALWLAAGLTAAACAVGRGTIGPAVHGEAATSRDGSAAVALQPHRLVRAPAPRAWRGAIATMVYVLRWMLRDTGWRVLALLGTTNVCVHAVLDARGADTAAQVTRMAVDALELHARLFLILLATIYAGELVWREREERSAALFDAMPLPVLARVLGGVTGVVLAQVALVSLLAVAAGVGTSLGAGVPIRLGDFLVAVVAGVLWPFVCWMVLALAVHSVVQQKVLAHLLCIAAWVVAAVFGGAARPGGMPVPWWAAALAATLALAVTAGAWRRGVLPADGPRVSPVQ